WQVNRPYETVSENEFIDHFHSPASLMRGDYETIIDNWLSVFPSNRLFIGFFDDIATRPRELLTAVFGHLGLAENVDWTHFPLEKVIYKGSDHPLPPKFRQILSQIYAPKIERLQHRFSGPCQRWLTQSHHPG
ncbi:MAG TPA: hypothetical protein VMD30_09795, partial [Tepidisphaeraceae bacterium]|nr:hypothetical protein [Tepidisphaeraceae bacterium]